MLADCSELGLKMTRKISKAMKSRKVNFRKIFVGKKGKILERRGNDRRSDAERSRDRCNRVRSIDRRGVAYSGVPRTRARRVDNRKNRRDRRRSIDRRGVAHSGVPRTRARSVDNRKNRKRPASCDHRKDGLMTVCINGVASKWKSKKFGMYDEITTLPNDDDVTTMRKRLRSKTSCNFDEMMEKGRMDLLAAGKTSFSSTCSWTTEDSDETIKTFHQMDTEAWRIKYSAYMHMPCACKYIFS